MSDSFDFSRWEILAARFIDNTLDDEQSSELMELLQRDPALAKVLYTHIFQESLFYDLAKGNGEIPDHADILGELGPQYIAFFEKDTKRRKSNERFRWRKVLTYSGSTALALMLVMTLFICSPLMFPATRSVPPQGAVQLASPKSEDLSSAVAVVKLASNMRSEEFPQSCPKSGDVLYPGRVAFDSGILLVEFFDGASILLEGPADVRFLSSNHVFCAKGRLMADVPEQAVGFRIDTPQTGIVDLGTAFEVDVRDENSFVRVLEGEIELHETAEGTKTLLKGEHALIGTDGILDQLAVNELPTTPVGTAELLERLEFEERNRLFEKWRNHYQRVNRDPSLLIQFNFSENHLFDFRKVRNLVAEREGVPAYGLLVDCRLTQGRWQEKGALEFRRLSDRCRFNIPGEFTALSMSTWMRVDGLPRLYNSILTTDGIDLGEIHWRLLSSGEVELLIHYSHTEPCLQIRSKKVITSSRFGEWIHLAASIDAENEQVVLYLDGEPIHREKFIQTVPIRFKNAQLGNWTIDPSWDSEQPIRHLTGAMESFLFFNRTLTDEEVKVLFVGE